MRIPASTDWTFSEWLQAQRELQLVAFKLDPITLEGDEFAEFVRWNALALTDELHEALNEVGWKTWATSRHINHEAFIAELTDLMHFLGNLLLIVGCTGEELTSAYRAKLEVNQRRQLDGYDGKKSKCPRCRRDYGGNGVTCRPKLEDGTPAYCFEYETRSE